MPCAVRQDWKHTGLGSHDGRLAILVHEGDHLHAELHCLMFPKPRSRPPVDLIWVLALVWVTPHRSCLLLLGSSHTVDQFCSNMARTLQRPQFVLFGDSLTQKAFDPQGGWAAALAHNYQRKAKYYWTSVCRLDQCQTRCSMCSTICR